VRVRSLAPGRFRDAEVLEHRLGAQEAGGHRQRGRAVRTQLGRQREAQPHDRFLDVVVGDDAPERDAGLPVADLHDQPVPGLDQQRQRVVRGDQMRLDAVAHDPQRVVERVLPHALDPAGERVAAPDVVDQHVQAAVLGPDPVHQRRDVGCSSVVAADGYPGPARGVDPLRGALDRLRSVHLRAPAAGRAAAAVDSGAERPELDSDRPAATPGGAATKPTRPVRGLVAPMCRPQPDGIHHHPGATPFQQGLGRPAG
jgi:hypothetical protein